MNAPSADNDNASIVIDCDEWIADEHDNPECTCEPCTRVRSSYEAENRRREALARGGLFPYARELFGAGWIDEDGKGGNVSAPQAVDVKSLAQRALGDVFEQLERVGSAGREKCRPASSAYYSAAAAVPLEQRIKRAEAVELLRCAENALDYARVHLDYLEHDARGGSCRALQSEPGARVLVAEDGTAERWEGVLVDYGKEDTCVVRDAAGLEHTVDARDLRSFAV